MALKRVFALQRDFVSYRKTQFYIEDESVIECTVPIEAEAIASPVAIVTSEPASGTPAGLQLAASAQSELTAPVRVDLLMMRLLTLIAMPALGA
jgi:hypothetical protein